VSRRVPGTARERDDRTALPVIDRSRRRGARDRMKILRRAITGYFYFILLLSIHRVSSTTYRRRRGPRRMSCWRFLSVCNVRGRRRRRRQSSAGRRTTANVKDGCRERT